MTITVNFQSSRIQVSADQAALDVSALYEAIKDAQDSEQGIMYSPIAAGAGKFDLGGGRSSGLVVRLNTPWQIEFLGSGQRTIDGGILVGGLNAQPVYPTTNTQVILNRPADAFGVATGGTTTVQPSGPSASEIALAVQQLLQVQLSRIDASISSRMEKNTVVQANVTSIKNQPVTGSGTKEDPWRPV